MWRSCRDGPSRWIDVASNNHVLSTSIWTHYERGYARTLSPRFSCPLISSTNRQVLGGVPRFYKGVGFALIQAPLSKFASVAANDFTNLITLYSNSTSGNVIFTTALGGVLAALMRAALMPIDTCKTVLQVDGSQGFQKLTNKVINCILCPSSYSYPGPWWTNLELVPRDSCDHLLNVCWTLSLVN